MIALAELLSDAPLRPARAVVVASAVIVSALVLGAIHGLAFGTSRAAFVVPATLAAQTVLTAALLATRRAALGACAAIAFCSAWIACGLDWLGASLARSTGLGPVLGSGFHLALAFVVSLPAASGLWLGVALALRAGGPVRALAALTGTFVLAELLRGAWFGSLALMQGGYAQLDSPLAGWLPLVGTPGVGALAALATFAVAWCVVAALRGERLRGFALATTTAVMLVAVGGGALLATRPWTTPGGALRLQLVQTDVEPGRPPRASEVASLFAKLDVDRTRTDLVVLPESALATDWRLLPPDALRTLAERLDAGRAEVLVGTYVVDPRLGPLNVALLLGPGELPGGLVATYYAKRHPMPFGERTPPGLGWFVDLLQVPMTDIGTDPSTPVRLAASGLVFRPALCLELLFGAELARDAREAGFLVGQSNAAWFPATRARAQLVGVARARALENRKPVVLAGNTGPTGVVAADGRVELLPGTAAGEFRATLVARAGATPYAGLGDAPTWLAALAALAFGVWRRPA